MKLISGSAFWVALMAMTACTLTKHSTVTQDTLVRNTQEMFDSVATGDQARWKRYLAEDSVYFDEKGRCMDKQLCSMTSPLFLQATPAASSL